MWFSCSKDERPSYIHIEKNMDVFKSAFLYLKSINVLFFFVQYMKWSTFCTAKYMNGAFLWDF